MELTQQKNRTFAPAQRPEEKRKPNIQPGEKTATSEMHRKWLAHERERRAVNDIERKRDERYVDGLMAQDDNASIEPWLRDVRINQLKPQVNVVCGEMAKRRLYPKIYAMAGDADTEMYKVAKLRDFQSRALFTASDFHNHRTTVADSALKSGDGWLRYGVRPGPGGAPTIFARYTRWESVFYDSQFSEANGSIDMGRFVAHISLVEWDAFKEAFGGDNRILEKARTMLRKQSTANQQALDDYDGSDFMLENAASPVMGEGEMGERDFVIYGVMFFRDFRTNELWKYPFITDRGLSDMIPIAPPSQPYSHHQFPFLRMVSDVFTHSGLPYSSQTRNQIGLSRVSQYVLRVMVKRIGGRMVKISKGARPSGGDGSKQMSLGRYMDSVSLRMQDDVPVVYSENAGSMEIVNLNTDAQQMGQLLSMLSGFQALSGGSPHESLRGGRGQHSGVSLREHLDNAIAGHRMLFETDRRMVEMAGRMNLGMIDDFGYQLPMASFLTEDGVVQYIGQVMGGKVKSVMDMHAPEITAGHMGVHCKAMERSADVTPEMIKFMTESVKGMTGDIEVLGLTVVGFLREANYHSGLVDSLIDVFVRRGVPFPEHLLSPSQRETQISIEQQNKQSSEEERSLSIADARAKIEKTAADALKSLREADKKEAETTKVLVEAGVAATPELEAEAAAPAAKPEGVAALAQKADQSDKLAAENAQLKEQLAAAQGGNQGALVGPDGMPLTNA